MKNSEMKKYTSPSVEVINADIINVISTSGFFGDDHVLGGATPASDPYEVAD